LFYGVRRKMTQMWPFTLPNGNEVSTTLEWKYVPYIDELRARVLENGDVSGQIDGSWEPAPTWEDMERVNIRNDKENWRRFYAAADEFVEQGTKPKHPIGWVLDKVRDHMDEPD
jgi:hypothetical protein